MKSSITRTTPMPNTPTANSKGIHNADMLNLSLIFLFYISKTSTPNIP